MAREPKTCAKQFRGLGVDDVGDLIGDLNPPRGAEFALNLLLHTFVFFVVLTLLYITVISPMETQALASQVQQSITQGVNTGLSSVTPAQAKVLQGALPALKTLLALSPDEDAVRVAHNASVLTSAWMIAGALGLAFIVSASVLGASRVRLAPTMGHVFAENAILFTILACIEGGFFLTVASKYVPVMPSVLAKTTVSTLKDNFPAPAMSASAST